MNARPVFDGHINHFIPPNKIVGWAVNLNNRENEKIRVSVRIGADIIGTGIANQFRQDLESFGSGEYAFELSCKSSLPYLAILQDEVSVDLLVGNSLVGELKFDQTTKNIVTVLYVADLLVDLNVFDAATLQNTLNHALPYIPIPVDDALRATITILKNQERLPPFSSFAPGSISPVFLKTGIISCDRAAMLGQEGHLFLIEGSNNVSEIFEKSYGQYDAQTTAEQWVALIRNRRDFVISKGCEFIQIIIPEKLSVLREFLDGHMSSPSAVLAALEQTLNAQFNPNHYVSGISVFSKLPYGVAFRKIDTHLTPIAAFSIFSRICTILNYNIVDNLPFDIPLTVTGDIAKRFFGYEFYEVCHVAKEPHFKIGLVQIESYMPPQGGYIGKRHVFKNDKAPIRKKVLLFGNSFFDNHVFQGSVSYWMSIWFQEYHFVFSPEMDAEYIEAEKPDVVICQTIERFLELIPDS